MTNNNRHTKHRPTKEEFYAVCGGTTEGGFGGYWTADLDSQDEYGYVNGYIPQDFDELEEIVLVFIATATQTPMYVRIVTDYGQAGENYAQHNEAIWLSVNTVLNRMTELDLKEAMDTAPLEAGDYFGIQARRWSGLPTENTDMRIIGVRLKYKYQ